MKANVGSYDAAIRFTFGCLLGGAGLHFGRWWGWFGLLPVATALVSFCPLYVPLHIDTTTTDQSHT